MIRRLASSAAAATGLLLLAAGLAACATPAASSPGGTTEPSAAPTDGMESDVDAAWLDAGRVVGVVTYGSSTCIPSATDASFDDGVLTVTLADPPADTACTRDFVPRVSLVEAPQGIDPASDLEVTVSGAVVGRAELGGISGLVAGGETDYAPSAGWTGTDGQFVILTWGSSSCKPVVEDVAATGPAEVTVTFQTPPADQVCTADMAPRGTLAQVTDLETKDAVDVVLAGGEFHDVRVKIIGTP